MKKLMMIAAMAMAYVSIATPQVGSVLVRQNWPWSTDIRVTYELSGITQPVDLIVKGYNDGQEVAIPDSAISGDIYRITESGVREFTINPSVVFGGSSLVAVSNFKVELSVTEELYKGEILYKIFDLENGGVEDVKRADILSGKKGSYVTSYSDIDSRYSTGLDDDEVLIWTGVANDTQYAKNKLVMRLIKAKDVVWSMGSPSEERGRSANETQHSVKFTNDYYIAVFPLTVYQANVSGLKPSGLTRWEYGNYLDAHGDKDLMPATMSLGYSRGSYTWPADGHLVDSARYLGKLRALFNNEYEFDVTTEAQWEFACRGGTTTILYDGRGYSNSDDTYMTANAGQLLGWSNGNSASTSGDTSTRGYWPVGMKNPNAYGLYDMVGNISERCLDYYAADYGGTDGVQIDPVGPASGTQNVFRGGNYALDASYYRSAKRTNTVSGGYEGLRFAFPVK